VITRDADDRVAARFIYRIDRIQHSPHHECDLLRVSLGVLDPAAGEMCSAPDAPALAALADDPGAASMLRQENSAAGQLEKRHPSDWFVVAR